MGSSAHRLSLFKEGSDDGASEDHGERQFGAHLGKYYDEVIAKVRDAESILIFGPPGNGR